jgi:arylsulfatase A-like enzyme
MDEQFGRLINVLKGRGLFDDALIIVCSDHGEGFGERGFIGHNSVPFDYEMKVPLIVKPAGFKGPGRRETAPVTLCDIAPTIYETLGIEPGIRMDGRSFLGILDGTTNEGEFDWPIPGMVFLVAHSLRWEDRQIVRNLDRETEKVTWSYYDLISDPGAFYDLYESEGILPNEDKIALIKWIDDTVADFKYLSTKAHEKKDLDDWTIEQLKAVGYLN